jgi:hypothetical protein
MFGSAIAYNNPINSLAGSLGQILVGSPSSLGYFSQQVFARYSKRYVLKGVAVKSAFKILLLLVLITPILS